MGEEYGETAPFQYFTSHTDPALAAAVTAGRKREFEAFAWQGEVPDPQDPATFERSRLCHRLRDEQPHAQLLAWYRELLRLRREWPVLGTGGEVAVSADEAARTLLVRRGTGDGEQRACLICSFSRQPCKARMPLPSGVWRQLLDAADERWGGAGVTTPERVDSDGAVELHLPAWGFAVYVPDAEAHR
jgi:maltooligosyltrehalose trehalohydrolase